MPHCRGRSSLGSVTWFQVCASEFWFFIATKVFIYSPMFLPNSATTLMVSLCFKVGLPCVGTIFCYMSRSRLLSQVINLSFLFFDMAWNCKNLATMAYSTGVILFRSAQYSVIDVNHMVGTDSLIAPQSIQSLHPKCCDDQFPVCKARMPHQWAGTHEASVSL